jgi:hypothetical protein
MSAQVGKFKQTFYIVKEVRKTGFVIAFEDKQ